MSYKVTTIPNFDKEFKRLAKKHHSIKSDIFQLGESLKKNPTMGTRVIENCYKVRMSISSKNKGKSGGARVITYIYVAQETVFLLSIYDKSEQENISDSEIKALIKGIGLED